MKVSIDHADRHCLERLHRMGGGTVQSLCQELGVTATAVRQRLARLQAMGAVFRETERSEQSGRGRPHHCYRVSEAGLRELGDNYSELALILWRELKSIEDGNVRRRIVDRVRE